MPNGNPAKQELSNKIMEVLCQSVSQTFETMVFLKVECGAAYSKPEGTPTAGISGTIGLMSDSMRGSVSLLFDKECGSAVFRSMMMMDADSEVADAELKDAIAELANMVAGGAKSGAHPQGIDFQIGLPAVTVGLNHHLETQSDSLCFIVPVKSEKGTFYLQVSLSIK